MKLKFKSITNLISKFTPLALFAALGLAASAPLNASATLGGTLLATERQRVCDMMVEDAGGVDVVAAADYPMPDSEGKYEEIGNYQGYGAEAYRSGWVPLTHLENLTALCEKRYAMKKKGQDTASFDTAIQNAVNYWFSFTPDLTTTQNNSQYCNNWWHRQIGVPRALGYIGVLAYDLLNDTQKQKIIAACYRSSNLAYKMENNNGTQGQALTGQNVIYVATAIGLGALVEDTPGAVGTAASFADAISHISGTIVRVSSGEGIRSDNTIHQHGDQVQFGGYGQESMKDYAFWVAVVAGTDRAFPPEKMDILTALAGSFEWVIHNGKLDSSSIDRQRRPNAETQKGQVVVDAIQRLGLTFTEKTGQGFHYFDQSALAVYRGADFMASVKMSTSTIRGTEVINNDSRRAAYFADGALFFTVTGSEYENVYPLWDNWHHIPGITVVDTGSNVADSEWLSGNTTTGYMSGDGASSYWGTTTISTSGNTVTYDFSRNEPGGSGANLSFRKSWSFSANGVDVTVSGITRTSGLGTVVTCVENAKVAASGANLVSQDANKTVVRNGPVVYTINAPSSAVTVVIDETDRTGGWNDNMQASNLGGTDATGRTLKILVDHGATPSNDGFTYSVGIDENVNYWTTAPSVTPSVWTVGSGPTACSLPVAKYNNENVSKTISKDGAAATSWDGTSPTEAGNYAITWTAPADGTHAEISASLSFRITASAPVYYLDGMDVSGKSSFSGSKDGIGWKLGPNGTVDPDHVVTSDSDYVVPSGTTLRTLNDNNDDTFAGNSLTLDAGSLSLKCQTNGSSKKITINRLTLTNGGSVEHSTDGSTFTIKGTNPVAIPAGETGNFSLTGSNTRKLDLSSGLTGAGTLNLRWGGKDWSSGGAPSSQDDTLTLSGDCSGFTGTITAKQLDRTDSTGTKYTLVIDGKFGGTITSLPNAANNAVKVNYANNAGLTVAMTTIPATLKTDLTFYGATTDFSATSLPLIMFPAGTTVNVSNFTVKHATSASGSGEAFTKLGVIDGANGTKVLVANPKPIYYKVASDSSNPNSATFSAEGWSDNPEATSGSHTVVAGEDYVVLAGKHIRCGATDDMTFPGDSLKLSGRIGLAGTHTYTFNNLIANGDPDGRKVGGTVGGEIGAWKDGTEPTLAGNISIPTGHSLVLATSGDKSRKIKVSAKISGPGTLFVSGGGGSSESKLTLTGDNSGFTGTVKCPPAESTEPVKYTLDVQGNFGGTITSLPSAANVTEIKFSYAGLDAEKGLVVATTTIPEALKAKLSFSNVTDASAEGLPLITFPEGTSVDASQFTVKNGSTEFTKLDTVMNDDGTITLVANYQQTSIEGATVSYSPANPTYNGSMQQPTVTVRLNDVDITDFCDVSWGSQELKNAGSYTPTITAKAGSRYEGSVTSPAQFTISKKQVSLNWGTSSFVYDGQTHVPEYTLGGIVSDDTCTISDISGGRKNVGSGTAQANGLSNSNYSLPGNIQQAITITEREVMLNWETTTFTYDGQSHAPTCTAGNLVGSEVCIVTVTGEQTAVGTHTATASDLTGANAGNYKLPSASGVTQQFTINAKSLTDAMVTLNKTTAKVNDPDWNVLPTVTVKDGGTTLGEGTGYTKSWSPSVVTGPNTYICTVTGTGNYQGDVTTTYVVSPADPPLEVNFTASRAGNTLTLSVDPIERKVPCKVVVNDGSQDYTISTLIDSSAGGVYGIDISSLDIPISTPLTVKLLAKYDTLDYVQATGAQGVAVPKVKYVKSQGLKITMRASHTQTHSNTQIDWAFGTSNGQFFGLRWSSATYYHFYGGEKDVTTGYTAINNVLTTSVEYDPATADLPTCHVRIQELAENSNTPPNVPQDDATMSLFSFNKNYYSYVKMYSLVVEQNGAVIADLIPIKDGGDGKLLDLKTGDVLASDTSTALTAGPIRVSKDALLGTATANVSIADATVTYSLGSATYDGLKHQPEVTVTLSDGETVLPSSAYTIAWSPNADFINAGPYTPTVTAKDGSRYTGSVTPSNPFTINKATAVIQGTLTITGWTKGDPPNPPSGLLAKNGIGTVDYKYSSSKGGTYSSDVPEEAGTYWVRGEIDGSDNWNAATPSAAVSFVIQENDPGAVPKPRLVRSSFVYDGTKKSVSFVSTEGFTSSGDFTATEIDEYTITCTLVSGKHWEGGSTDPVDVTWRITEEDTRSFLQKLADDDRKVGSSPYATGGDIILFDEASGDYIHVFTNTAATGTFTLNANKTARILCVGGGGSGGSTYEGASGGGGAGGVEYNSAVELTASTSYAVTVGKGGTWGSYDSSKTAAQQLPGYMEGVQAYQKNYPTGVSGGESGVRQADSTTISAYGGGYGRQWNWGNKDSGSSVGGASAKTPKIASGGGCGYANAKDGGAASGQGNNGSSKSADTIMPGNQTGGGGGAGRAGTDLTVGSTTAIYGQGGDGVACDILGFNQVFGGGGSGYSSISDVPGGLGGGGSWDNAHQLAVMGEDGLGGGGPGASSGWLISLDGGSGLVVIRYSGSNVSTAKTVLVPTAIEGLYYTGWGQTGVPSGEGYTLSGVYRETNAGNYTATATIDTGYTWADGQGGDTRTITWSIAKADISSVPGVVIGVTSRMNLGSRLTPVEIFTYNAQTVAQSNYDVEWMGGLTDAGEYNGILTIKPESKNFTNSAPLKFLVLNSSDTWYMVGADTAGNKSWSESYSTMVGWATEPKGAVVSTHNVNSNFRYVIPAGAVLRTPNDGTSSASSPYKFYGASMELQTDGTLALCGTSGTTLGSGETDADYFVDNVNSYTQVKRLIADGGKIAVYSDHRQHWVRADELNIGAGGLILGVSGNFPRAIVMDNTHVLKYDPQTGGDLLIDTKNGDWKSIFLNKTSDFSQFTGKIRAVDGASPKRFFLAILCPFGGSIESLPWGMKDGSSTGRNNVVVQWDKLNNPARGLPVSTTDLSQVEVLKKGLTLVGESFYLKKSPSITLKNNIPVMTFPAGTEVNPDEFEVGFMDYFEIGYTPRVSHFTVTESKGFGVVTNSDATITLYANYKQDEGLVVTCPSQIANGTKLTPNVTVTYFGNKLQEDEDYELGAWGPAGLTEAGTYTAAVTGINDYEGLSGTATFEIKAAGANPLAGKVTVTGFETSFDYAYHTVTVTLSDYADGAQVRFRVDGDANSDVYPLTQPPSYREPCNHVVYWQATKAGCTPASGSVNAIITATENSWKTDAAWNNTTSPNTKTVNYWNAGETEHQYTAPTVSSGNLRVYLKLHGQDEFYVWNNEWPKVPGEYWLQWLPDEQAGVDDSDLYDENGNSKQQLQFIIKGTISGDINAGSKVYDGTPGVPAYKITYEYDTVQRDLKEGVDYTLGAWSKTGGGEANLTDVGTYTCTVSGKYPYEGTITLTYTVTKAANEWTQVPPAEEYSWKQSENPPQMTRATLRFGTPSVTATRDGVAVPDFDLNNLPITPGQYVVTFTAPTGRANYSDPSPTTQVLKFEIIADLYTYTKYDYLTPSDDAYIEAETVVTRADDTIDSLFNPNEPIAYDATVGASVKLLHNGSAPVPANLIHFREILAASGLLTNNLVPVLRTVQGGAETAVGVYDTVTGEFWGNSADAGALAVHEPVTATVAQPSLVESIRETGDEIDILAGIDTAGLLIHGTTKATLPGTYVCQLTPDDGHIWNNSTFGTYVHTWTITEDTRDQVPQLTGKTVVYNGSPQEGVNYKSEDLGTVYTLSNYSQTESGQYTAVATLTDANKRWQGTHTNVLEIPWEIQKAANSWSPAPAIEGGKTQWDPDAAPALTLGVPVYGKGSQYWEIKRPGSAEFVVWETPSLSAETAAGEYAIREVVPELPNYTALESEFFFTVLSGTLGDYVKVTNIEEVYDSSAKGPVELAWTGTGEAPTYTFKSGSSPSGPWSAEWSEVSPTRTEVGTTYVLIRAEKGARSAELHGTVTVTDPLLSAVEMGGPKVKVKYDWLKAAYGATKSLGEYQEEFLKPNANGVKAWAAYILGFEGANKDSWAIIEKTTGSTTDKGNVMLTVELPDLPETKPTVANCTVRYSLLTSANATELQNGKGDVVAGCEKCETPRFSVPAPTTGNHAYYRIRIHFIFEEE